MQEQIMDMAIAQSLLSIEKALDDEMDKMEGLGVRPPTPTHSPPLTSAGPFELCGCSWS